MLHPTILPNNSSKDNLNQTDFDISIIYEMVHLVDMQQNMIGARENYVIKFSTSRYRLENYKCQLNNQIYS